MPPSGKDSQLIEHCHLSENLEMARLLVGILLSSFAFVSGTLGIQLRAEEVAAKAASPIKLVVMDPLAADLSCPCVEGYAQRKYQLLADHLQQQLQRGVELVFVESLGKAAKPDAASIDLVIGKDSVVRSDAEGIKLDLTPICALTDKAGITTQHGLFVVHHKAAAQRLEDLTGYQIFFGPVDSSEKHFAAVRCLLAAGVELPGELEMVESCSDGAGKLIGLGANAKAAVVISSYAQPLLEGCGTVEKGELRVIGKTEEVAFITAFVATELPLEDRHKITAALLAVGKSPELCEGMESLLGFVPLKTDVDVAAKKN
jgi:ABC-type phosphate/phosphonate transport system substrate-binding protein